LFLEMWTIVPAPNLYTLVLAAAIPERTPWAIGWCLLAGIIAQFAARGWPRTAGVACAALALGFALVPWCLLPATVSAGEREMRAGFGDAYAAAFARSPYAWMFARPYSVRIALAGYPRPSGLRVRLNLLVPTRDGRRLGLDLYAPPAPGPHPTVIVVYGGAWIFGSRAASAELARSLAGLGYTAIAIDYRHAPAYQFPTQIDDVRDALTAIARNAGDWNVDPRRVAMLGRSSGAELALIAAYDPGPLTMRAAIAFYAPTDLVQGYRLPPRPDPARVDRILRLYLGGTPDERMNNYVAASPIAHVRPELPPTLLFAGGRDELVQPGFAREMRDALRQVGNQAAVLRIPWSNHGFDEIPTGTGGQLARYYLVRFLAATL
jgi:acetyl esterase/lipase